MAGEVGLGAGGVVAGEDIRWIARNKRSRAPMLETPSCSERCCSVNIGNTSMLISSRTKCCAYCPIPILSSHATMVEDEGGCFGDCCGGAVSPGAVPRGFWWGGGAFFPSSSFRSLSTSRMYKSLNWRCPSPPPYIIS